MWRCQQSEKRKEFKLALEAKTKERGTLTYLEHYKKYLADIKSSQDLAKIWQAYTQQYSYATGIQFQEILACPEKLLEGLTEA